MLKKRCRLCAEIKDDLNEILDELELSSKINGLFQIKIEAEDKLPTTICVSCLDEVNNIWEFNGRVHKAQAILCDFNDEEQEIDVSQISDNKERIFQLDVKTNISTGTVSITKKTTTNKRVRSKQQDKVKIDDTELPAVSDIKVEIDETIEIDKSCIFEPSVQTDLTITSTLITKKKKTKPTTKLKLTNKQVERLKTSDGDLIIPGITDAIVKDDGSIDVDNNNICGWDRYPWKCSNCQEVFNKVEDLMYHYIETHEEIVKFSCADCPKVLSNYVTIMEHIKMHRPALRYCCDICGKWYPTPKLQEEHYAKHEDETPHCCTTCGKKYRFRSFLVIHSKTHLPLERRNYHQCDECQKKFATSTALKIHKQSHAGVREYTCDKCGKSFVQKSTLRYHVLTHNSERPFQCSTCGKYYKTLGILKKHSKKHLCLKPYQCDICGRQLCDSGTLKQHYNIHTEAKPYKCDYCGKNFRFKGVLRTHIRLHTGERPYSCQECQHHFANWCNYNKHMKGKHGINIKKNP